MYLEKNLKLQLKSERILMKIQILVGYSLLMIVEGIKY